jgi:type II secretory pathway pseudopilin PulG
MAMQHQRRFRLAFTMAEIVISTVIVGVMTVAALESVNMVYRVRRLNSNRLTAQGLAQEILAEVVAMPYADPQNPAGAIGLDAGENSTTRSTFDDVDDYHNWQSGPTRRDGAALTGYTGWQMQVSVAYAQLPDPSTNAISDSGLKRITVTVTDADARQTTLAALRARSGSLEQPQGLTATSVTALSAALRVGNGTQVQRWAVAPTNPASDVP